MQDPITIKKRLRRTKSEMFPLMAAYEKSDQSQAEFCQAHRLNVHVLNYWLDKYRKASLKKEVPQEQLIPVQIDTSSGQSTRVMEVQLKNGTLIRFDRLVPHAYIEKLIDLGDV
jgi:transposase-like protein